MWAGGGSADRGADSARRPFMGLRCAAPTNGFIAPVAQLDRALASGAKGRRFESCRARFPPSLARDHMRAMARWRVSACASPELRRSEGGPGALLLIRGASPLGLPYTRSRSPLRRLAPIAWLARAARSLFASPLGRPHTRPPSRATARPRRSLGGGGPLAASPGRSRGSLAVVSGRVEAVPCGR